MNPARQLVLTRNGQATASIVVEDRKPAPPVVFAAEELQRYLRLMSGAALPIASARTRGPRIVLSTRRPDVMEQEDAHSLKSDGETLRLSGASPRAVLYAAYLLLERLGCGFCVPGEDTVPRRRTVTVPNLDATEAPAFTTRSQVDHPFQPAYPIETSLAIIDWLAKNRFNWYHPTPNAWGEPEIWYQRRGPIADAVRRRGLHLQLGGHTMHTWLPPARYFDRHPDWFALIDGAGAILPGQYHRIRQGPAACISHPDVRRTVINNICRFLDRCPEVEAVDLWDPDVQGYCHCPKCLRGVTAPSSEGWRLSGPRTGGYAQTFDEEILRTAYAVSFVEFINAVARGVREKHPRVSIGSLVYTPNGVPAPQWCPNLEDNVVLAVAHILRDSYIPLAGGQKSEVNLRFLAMDVSWMQKTDRLVIYEYYHAWTSFGLCPQVNVIAEDLRLLSRLGFRGVENDQWGWSPLNIYAAARLLWHPELKWKDIIKDFCGRYYGDAAAEMQEYWLDLELAMRGRTGYIAQRGDAGPHLKSMRRRSLRRLTAILRTVSDDDSRRRIERELIPWKATDEPQNMRFALPDSFAQTGAGGP